MPIFLAKPSEQAKRWLRHRAPTGSKGSDNKSQPKLPEFRGEDPKACAGPYEFLRKCESQLNAERLSEDRWIDAMLQPFPADERAWAKAAFKGKKWGEMQAQFIERFDAPAMRGKLRSELSSIKKAAESAQESSDRFASLRKRAGMKGNNPALVGPRINGLSYSLQSETRKSKAAESRVLKAAVRRII
eukprot:Plantae.Rhodophyta-Hildenbrandia_rubra.ctg43859.p1 GENE.Plantae.Rhodophyta-Hildenbrandia_rubra.ctg43859~~Plantae.Rhodophyta-Hildenbrandia_rubra.ctg43859.p1  ORF type:complete len:188 (+),score=20.51 Plantae.Rhodophyta-Hildenbrandia_rubra.ctg43859:278-841(+)